MRVVVATPARVCAATLALTAEGVEFEVALCSSPFRYGEAVADRWQDGTGFILLEWDIVPWPGALTAIWECSRLLCRYPYPAAGESDFTLGCVKFSAELTRRYPMLPEQQRWTTTDWEALDGNVCVPLLEREMVHRHSPWLAHVRRLEGDATLRERT